jgi:hypothetical protein
MNAIPLVPQGYASARTPPWPRLSKGRGNLPLPLLWSLRRPAVREHRYGVLKQSEITDTEHGIAEDQRSVMRA